MEGLDHAVLAVGYGTIAGQVIFADLYLLGGCSVNETGGNNTICFPTIQRQIPTWNIDL